jgi:lipopolysaccharide export system ATP-binding protein
VNTTPALKAARLCKSFAGRRVVDSVELSLSGGEIVGVLGPNGAGKSTLLHLLTGLVAADEGCVFLRGREVTTAPLHVRCELGLGFLPQDAASFPELSVEQNVRAVIECLPWSRGERRERLAEILALGQLRALAHSEYGTLSGGERRRVEIAKAIVRRPSWLLLDEPYAALDPHSTRATNLMLRQLAAAGTGILIADHRFEVVLEMAQRVLVLAAGKVIADGDPAAVRRDARAAAAYFEGGRP